MVATSSKSPIYSSENRLLFPELINGLRSMYFGLIFPLIVKIKYIRQKVNKMIVLHFYFQMLVLLVVLYLASGVNAKSFPRVEHPVARNTRPFGLEEILQGDFASRGFGGTWISGNVDKSCQYF